MDIETRSSIKRIKHSGQTLVYRPTCIIIGKESGLLHTVCLTSDGLQFSNNRLHLNSIDHMKLVGDNIITGSTQGDAKITPLRSLIKVELDQELPRIGTCYFCDEAIQPYHNVFKCRECGITYHEDHNIDWKNEKRKRGYYVACPECKIDIDV